MKYDLALVSAVFLWFPLGVLFGWIIVSIIVLLGGEIPPDSSLIFYTPLVVFSIISFIGSILLLTTARINSSKFYWLIPLCLTLFAVIAVGEASFLKLFSADTSTTLFGIASLMLVPCSIPVFLSLPISGSVRSIALGLTEGFSICSVLVTIYVVDQFLKFGDNSFDGIIPLLALYWMFLMPIIGICYLACAFVSPKTASNSS